MLYRFSTAIISACMGSCVLPAWAEPGNKVLEEIVVRAQYRDQRLQEVPLAITVLDSSFLQQHRLQQIQSIVMATPGLSGWEQGVSTPIFAIRGISSNSFGVGGESSVGLFVDETYRGRINSTSIKLVDVEQVEVLKGPQGTLFGRNSSAGAILVRHYLPTEKLSLEATVEAGDNRYRGLQATANVPLTAAWSMRFSGFSFKDDGALENTWLNEGIGNNDTQGGQWALHYGADSLDATFRLAAQQTHTSGLGYETLEPALAAAGNVRPNAFDNVLTTDINTYDDVENQDASVQVNWALTKELKFTTITAWHHNDSPNLFDVDGSAIFLTSAGFTSRDSRTLSQEFRLHGSTGPLDWVGGVIVFDEDIKTTIELGYSDVNQLTALGLCSAVFEPVFGPCQDTALEIAKQRGDYFSTGVFGDVSWHFTDDLTLGAGLRYSYDDKEFRYRAAPVTSVITRLNASELNPSGNILGYATEGWEQLQQDWDDWQPRLYANWAFSADHNAFANLAKGFKAGGFDPKANTSLSTFAPEQVWNLDLGLRGAALQQRLSYQLTGFVYDYQDYQVQVIAEGIAHTGNAAKVDGHGVELEVIWNPLPALTLGLTGSWQDIQFKDYDTEDGDFRGNSPILAPEYTASFSVDWRSRQFAWGSLGASLLSSYQSEVFFTVQNSRDAHQSGFYRHDAKASYFTPARMWQLDVFVRNLGDEDYFIFQQDVGSGPVARSGESRFWGMAVTARL